jgi:uncharacterized protein VirK/YbjX
MLRPGSPLLFDDYKDRAKEFEQQEKALNEIFSQITDTIARPLRTYFRQLNTPYEILQALTRSYDLVKEYQALKKVPRYRDSAMADEVGDHIR